MRAKTKTLYLLSGDQKGVKKRPAAFAVSLLPDDFDGTELWANGEEFDDGPGALEQIVALLDGKSRMTIAARVSISTEAGAVRFLVIPDDVDAALRVSTERIVETQKIPAARAYYGQLLTGAVADKVALSLPKHPGSDELVLVEPADETTTDVE